MCTVYAAAAWLGEGRGTELRLEADLDQVSALAPERDALWKRVTEAEFLDEAEKRRLLGLPERG